MPLYDYRCSEGHVSEALASMDCTTIACRVCATPAVRLGAYRVAVTQPEVDVRGKFRRFREATAELDATARTVEASTGQAVTTPNYWTAARQRLTAMHARGEAPAVRKEQLQ